MPYALTPYGGLPGLLLVEGRAFPDDRGFFMESWRADDWAGAGLPPLVQDNFSRSRRGVLRGLHFQKEPAAIGKLVRCSRGKIFDVAVDLRRGSPTYGKWTSLELTGEGNRAFWVPAGFAHGFCALSETADVAYKVTGFFDPAADGGVRWDDPALGIEWPLPRAEIVVSPKDAALPLAAEAETGFVWRG